VTDKDDLMREGNQYIFESTRAPTRSRSRRREKLFKVKVIDVRTLNVLGREALWAP